MATASVDGEEGKRRRWRPQWSLRTQLLLVAVLSAGLGILAAYFDEAQIDGSVYFAACACGMKHAEVCEGNIVLSEPNHDRPAGTVVASIELKDGLCTIRLTKEDGSLGPAQDYSIDHLGAKCYDEDAFGSQPIYVLLVDNWKLYPACAVMWLKRTLR